MNLTIYLCSLSHMDAKSNIRWSSSLKSSDKMSIFLIHIPIFTLIQVIWQYLPAQISTTSWIYCVFYVSTDAAWVN